MRLGVDSAIPPNPQQALYALHQGVEWWGLYLAGHGAMHNWTPPNVQVLRETGFELCLPVFVPALRDPFHGDYRIRPSENPELDADDFASAINDCGLSIVGALDTEPGMRDDPWTVEYALRFGERFEDHGTPVVYATAWRLIGHYPLKWNGWFAVPDATTVPPDRCYQTGNGSLAGVTVDWDICGDDFPLARINPSKPIVSAPPSEEDDMSMPALISDPTSGGTWTVTRDGAVWADAGAPYLGGLNTHPEWNAGTPTNPSVGIAPWKDKAGLMGYVIVTLAIDGVHHYHFPRDGSLAVH